MESQDHIATLCAAGTLGIAATGLALGVSTENDNTTSSSITPGKRKWPGATPSRLQISTTPISATRRVVSQPVGSILPAKQDKPEHHRSTSLFRRQSKRDVRPAGVQEESDVTGSRGSSSNRSGLFRPRSADTRSTSERRDRSAGSSWLKRISMVSSPPESNASVQSPQPDSLALNTSSTVPPSGIQTLPNKLVKRSTSQKALFHDQAKSTFLKRPATSHQRSAAVHEWVPHETSYSTPATPLLTSDTSPIWRPFFERGYPRKRHTTANLRENLGLRTVSASNIRQPTLMLGSHIEPTENSTARAENSTGLGLDTRQMSTGRQRLRRSLSSMQRAARRRHCTDPTVKVTTEAVNGTFTSLTSHSPLSSSLTNSPFEARLPSSSPAFSSSPPLPGRQKFLFKKRQSTAPSDPTTTSSDNDMRVFTDDDSMDFQSDTAYDSLTTRATASSNSALRTPNLEAIFHDPQISHVDETDTILASLVEKATLSDETTAQSRQKQSGLFLGMGISAKEEADNAIDHTEASASNRTPVKYTPNQDAEYNLTPAPRRLQYFGAPIRSSPPILGIADVNRHIATPEFIVRKLHNSGRKDSDDGEVDEEIDWSPKSDKHGRQSTSTLQYEESLDCTDILPSNNLSSSHRDSGSVNDGDNESDKRLSSFFEWSEQQKVASDGVDGMQIRPRTVHGKQTHDALRSRSSSRKSAPQVHMRSQSVPHNRDLNAEQEPIASSKYGTWGLGHKKVSEEWSDDFEFDDAEDSSPQVSLPSVKSSNYSTLRGIKIPPAIIEQQEKVHIQFGQVQEFMLLVEELKNLRAKGLALQLLDSHSKQLWADAESIIDLATINNEEATIPQLGSPTSSDVFQDESAFNPIHVHDRGMTEDNRPNSVVFRSVSSPATPPHGRPRGESLAQAKNLLQSIQQTRSGFDSSPMEFDDQPQRKLPFDTQDLKNLVIRSGVITRALKEIVRKAEGLSNSPVKSSPKPRDPAFSQIFNAPDASPCPPFRKSGLPKSKSANSYLLETYNGNHGTISPSQTPTTLVL